MKLLYIEWEDHSGFAYNRWRALEDFSKNEPILCRSVGWVIRETDKIIILAASQSQDRESFQGDITIMKKCIVKRRLLHYK